MHLLNVLIKSAACTDSNTEFSESPHLPHDKVIIITQRTNVVVKEAIPSRACSALRATEI